MGLWGELSEGFKEFTSQLREDTEVVREAAKQEVEKVRGAAEAADLAKARQALASKASGLGQHLEPARLLELGAVVFKDLEGAITQADVAVGALLEQTAARVAGGGAGGGAEGGRADNSEAARARHRERERAIATNHANWTRPVADAAGFAAFCDGFELLAHTERIEALLREQPPLRATHQALVPAVLSYRVFWERYFYEVELLQRQEKKRQALLRPPSKAQPAPQLSSWGEDDPFASWSDEPAPRTKQPAKLPAPLPKRAPPAKPSPSPVPLPLPLPPAPAPVARSGLDPIAATAAVSSRAAASTEPHGQPARPLPRRSLGRAEPAAQGYEAAPPATGGAAAAAAPAAAAAAAAAAGGGGALGGAAVGAAAAAARQAGEEGAKGGGVPPQGERAGGERAAARSPSTRPGGKKAHSSAASTVSDDFSLASSASLIDPPSEDAWEEASTVSCGAEECAEPPPLHSACSLTLQPPPGEEEEDWGDWE